MNAWLPPLVAATAAGLPLLAWLRARRALAAERAARAEAIDAERGRDLRLAAAVAGLSAPLHDLLEVAAGLSDADLAPDQRACLERVAEASRRLAALGEDVVEVVRRDRVGVRLESRPFALRTVLEDAVAGAAGGAGASGIAVTAVVSARLPAVVLGDAARLHQVAAALLARAVRATRHGEVVLRALPRDGAIAGCCRLDLVVSDGGDCLDALARRRFFEPFADDGSGVGMWVARRIIEAAGGSIAVASGSRGTAVTVTLDLPVAPAPRDTALGVRVLVAVDDAVLRESLEEQLRSLGAEPVPAPSPAQAGRAAAAGPLDAALVIAPWLGGLQSALAAARIPILAVATSDAGGGRMVAVRGQACLPRPLRTAVLAKALARARSPATPTPAVALPAKRAPVAEAAYLPMDMPVAG